MLCIVVQSMGDFERAGQLTGHERFCRSRPRCQHLKPIWAFDKYIGEPVRVHLGVNVLV